MALLRLPLYTGAEGAPLHRLGTERAACLARRQLQRLGQRRHADGEDRGRRWVCFAEGIENGTLYKYCVTGADGRQILKSDPFAAYSQTGSETASIVWNGGDFRWGDGEYMQRRAKRDFMTQPMSIYELHLGSWKNMPGERPLYRELADALADYCTDMGYTHIEIMPVTEYPLTRHGAIRSRATTRRPRATAIPTISSTSSTGCTKLGSR